MRLFKFRLKHHQWPCNKVGSVNLTEHLVGFEQGTFQFICNILTHWATAPKLMFSRRFDFYQYYFKIILAYLLYFQMKPQLLIVIGIFKLSFSKQKSVMRVSIWQKRLCSSGTCTYLSRLVCFQRFSTGANKQYQNITNNILVKCLII